MVGIALITTYVGIGMVLGPINHIRGYPDPRTELAGVRNRRTGIQVEISTIQQNRLVYTSMITYAWVKIPDDDSIKKKRSRDLF